MDMQCSSPELERRDFDKFFLGCHFYISAQGAKQAATGGHTTVADVQRKWGLFSL